MPGVEIQSKAADFVQLLEWRELDGTLVVTPRDEDRFSIKLNRAIDVLRRASNEERVASQLRLLLRTLAEWIARRDDIASAYLTLREGGLCVLLVRKEVLYSESFEDAVTELDIALANDVDLDLIAVNVMALPNASNEAIASFLDPEFAIQYTHGDGAGQPAAGQQGP
jgi:hypothetical protein